MPATSAQTTQVTAVIPAMNEAPSIAGIVQRTRPFCARVLVVDGRSTDDTVAIARAEGADVIMQQGPRGKGAALRFAVTHVTTPVTVFLDADGSHVPEDIPLVVEPIIGGRADHVSASRLIGGSSELHGGFDEFFRLAGSSFITACINRRFRVALSDSQNGFRAIRTELLQRLDLTENSTTIEQQMIIKTLKAGGRIVEVPSHEHRRLYGVSHIRVWRAAPRYVYSVARDLLLP
jgi:glycosyltransferase involved in cell wall biosynthesis